MRERVAHSRRARWTRWVLAATVFLGPGFSAQTASSAGEVRVSVDRGGNLLLAGDRLANELLLTPTGALANELRVSGLAGTLVNGASEAVVVATGRIDALLGAGDDVLLVRGRIPNALDVAGAGGSDFVGLGCPSVLRTPALDLAPDEEVVCGAPDVVIEQTLRIRTGAGDDLVLLFFAAPRAGVAIETGPGEDVVEAGLTDFGGSLVVDTGAGDDRVSLAGSDLPTVISGDLVIRTRGGADLVGVGRTTVAGTLALSLGSQADQLEIACSFVSGEALLSGGAAPDTFTEIDDNLFAGGLVVKGFETVGEDPERFCPFL